MAHSRIIVLADSCISVRGAALAARYLAAFFHSQFRPPFGIASEEGLCVFKCMRSGVMCSTLSPWEPVNTFSSMLVFLKDSVKDKDSSKKLCYGFFFLQKTDLQVPRAVSVVVHDGEAPVFRFAHYISQVWHLPTWQTRMGANEEHRKSKQAEHTSQNQHGWGRIRNSQCRGGPPG
jgi:hypothetical protein